MFITLEGVEGSGKTTIATTIHKKLNDAGITAIYTREPGGNFIAEQIRDVILNQDNKNMREKTEVLLYAAARHQHLQDVIIPALNEGKIVICDRFVDSSIAYQGFARGLDPKIVSDVNVFATNGLSPDLTLFIDVKPEIGLNRITNNCTREVNRLDLESLEFHNKVYEGYLYLLENNKRRIVRINGQQTINQVEMDVYNEILSRLGSC